MKAISSTFDRCVHLVIVFVLVGSAMGAPVATPQVLAAEAREAAQTPTDPKTPTETPTGAVQPTDTATETPPDTTTPTDTPPSADTPAPSDTASTWQIYLPLILHDTSASPSPARTETPLVALGTSNSGSTGIVYLANKGQVARSRDFYTSSPHWENVTGNLPIPISNWGGINEFTLDPFDPLNRAWVALGNFGFTPPDGSRKGSVWRTNDLNAPMPTWTEVLSETMIVSQTLPLSGGNAIVQRVLASSLRPGLVFIAAAVGDGTCNCYRLFVGRSSDYGASWTWSGMLGDNGDRAIGFELSDRNVNRLWVGLMTPARILVSNDGGSSFTQLFLFTEGNPFWHPYDIHVPAHNNPNDQTMFAVVDGAASRTELYRSTNGGQNFITVTHPVTLPGALNGMVGSYTRDSRRAFYTKGGACNDWIFMYSTDGGSTWAQRASFTGATAGFTAAWGWPTNPKRFLTAQGKSGGISFGLVVARYSEDGGFTWQDKTGNWAAAIGDDYFGSPGTCGGTASVTILDAAAIPKVLDRSVRSGSTGASKAGPARAQGDGREGAISDCECQTQGQRGDPINTRAGGFDLSTVDLSLPTAAGPLAFQRTYASVVTNTYTATLGYGWTHNHDTRLSFETDGFSGDVIWFKAHSANEYRFDVITSTAEPTVYQPYPGVLASLTFTTVPTNTYTLIGSDQAAYTFDGTGKLQTWKDPQGHSLTYTYSMTTGLLTQIAEPLSGRSLTFEYNSGQAGRLSAVRDHQGRRVAFGYDGAGDLVSVTDVLTQTWSYVYSGTTHLLWKVVDPRGVTTTRTEYDSPGRAVAQYDGLNNRVAEVGYDLNGATVITDARGISETQTYNGLNTLTGEAAPLGQVITKTYDATFHPAAITDPLSRTTNLAWSDDGANLTQVADALSQTTRLGYDALNNLTQTVDARGLTTTLAYTGTLLTVLTDTLTNRMLYTYTTPADAPQPVGLLKATSDALGHTTQYQYDALGQQTRMTDAAGIVTTYGYDSLGRVVTTTTALGTPLQVVTVNQYDAAGRMTQSTRNYLAGQGQNYLDRYNLITRYQYDAVGNQTVMTDTLSRVTRTEYDNLNRPVTVTVNYSPTATGVDYNLVSLTAYDANGNVISTTQYANTSLARTTLTGYDELNRPVTVTTNYVNGAFDPLEPDEDLQTVTAYDAAGNVLSTTQYANVPTLARITLTGYDPLNRPVTVTTNYAPGLSGPDKNITTTTQYDANGNVITTTQFYGLAGLERKTYTEYDALNRPVTVTTNYVDGMFNGAEPDKDLQSLTRYDAVGNVISTTQYANTSLARTGHTGFDSANRPVTATTNYVDGNFNGNEPDRDVIQITTYGPAGERQATTEQRGGPGLVTTLITTTYSYDNLGRLITTTWPLTGSLVASTTVTYDALGRVIESRDPLGHVTRTEYDALGQAVTVTVNYVPGGPSDAQTNLKTVTTYDAAGNRVQVKDPKGTVTQFQYDLLDRLVRVTDALTGTTRYGYDAAGNVISMTDALTHTTAFTYDLLNRLVSSTDPLTQTTQYRYDAAGNQIGLTDANGKVITSTYDLLNRLTAIDYPVPDADVFFTFNGAGERTVMTDSLGVTAWAYDQLSRPLTITQPFTGPVVYTYDSAGNRLALKYPDGKVVTSTYDLASRLIQVKDWQAQTTGYAYNALGQPLTVTLPNSVTSTYRYDQVNRLLTITHTTGITLSSFAYTYR